MKTFFHLNDNIIDKKIQEIIDSKKFNKRKAVNAQINEVINFFADNFAGSRDKALNLLD
jgi:hypothetical protein